MLGMHTNAIYMDFLRFVEEPNKQLTFGACT